MTDETTFPSPQKTIAAADEGIQQRLQQLAKKFSKSEIARKTGTPLSSVSRYLRGAAVAPVTFCCRLVEAFGVSSTWLLEGQGKPLVTESAAGDDDIASGMSSLVQAINAVVKMRLGSLVGKEHGQNLRRLNDALKEYKGLREQLNRQTTPLYEKLLGDVNEAIKRADVIDAKYILRALRQLSDINDSAELGLRLASAEVAVAYCAGEVDKVLQNAKSVFERTFAADWMPIEQRIGHAIRYTLALYQMRRIKEYRRTLEAALQLYQQAESSPQYAHLLFERATADVELGSLYEGLDGQIRAYARLKSGDERHLLFRLYVLYTHLLAGTLTLEEAFTTSRDTLRTITPSQASVYGTGLLGFACWDESPPVIKDMLDTYLKVLGKAEAEGRLAFVYVSHLAQALSGDRSAAARFSDNRTAKEAMSSPRPGRFFNTHANYARILFLSGKTKPALAETLALDEWRRKLPDDVSLHILSLGVHFRNVLRTIPKTSKNANHQELRRQALAFFEDYRAKGYDCFRHPSVMEA